MSVPFPGPICIACHWGFAGMLKALVFEILQKLGITMSFRRKPRDARELCDAFDGFVYERMARDRIRNDAYRSAIGKHVASKTVLEIGTGPLTVLADMCLEAGASKVYALESNEQSFDLACRKTLKENKGDRLKLIRGYSTDATLPGQCDVLVHEIVGNIGSAEGMCVAVNDARTRLLKPDASFIPASCTTLFCPVSTLSPGVTGRALIAAIPKARLPDSPGAWGVYNYPAKNCLSVPADFEHIVFSDSIPLEGRESTRLQGAENRTLRRIPVLSGVARGQGCYRQHAARQDELGHTLHQNPCHTDSGE